jgi:ribosomal protein S18 acetylase RimI-like enzyme
MEDGQVVVDMWNEESVELVGVPVADLEWLTAPWAAEDADLEQDFAVIVADGGEVVAYLMLESDPPYTRVFSVGGVRLQHHGRGLGAAIVRDAERRAQRFVAMAPPSEGVVLHIGTLSDEPLVSELLGSQGFREVRRFWSMRIRFERAPLPPEPIPGIEIRPPRPGEEGVAYQCLAEAFQDHWGGTFETEERWLRLYVGVPHFEPGLWRLAWRGERLVGALVGEPHASQEPDLGYIALVGVRAEARGQGIADAMLRSSFVGFHQRGIAGAQLLVDSESTTGANRLYERVGMEAQPRFSTWEKTLRRPHPS